MSAWETNGATDEWYTPRFIFEALGCDYARMGAGLYFDLDVAPAKWGRGCVPATRTMVDSLNPHSAWFGFVWMNPPFGGRNAVIPWLDKFFAHGNGIALTPDRTSAPWFWDAWAKANLVMFTRKIRFIRPDGSEGKSPSCGTALWASGERGIEALLCAADRGLGILATPRPPAIQEGHRPSSQDHDENRSLHGSVE